MLLIFTKRRWGNYWQLLRRWFEHKIDELKAAVNSVAQSIDFTPVNEKLDDIKEDVGDVKDAVQNIDFSELAKQGTNPNATLSAVLEALQGSDTPSPDIPEGVAERLALILEYFGIKPISDYEFMTDTEVCGELEDIMQLIDPNLTAAQAAAITEQTLNPSES